MANFDGTDELFDSRDVIERIAELENTEVIDREPEEQDELDALYALQEEADGVISDWQYGETFYTWDALVEYTEDLATDCGYLTPETPSWITNHIDWEAVTEEVKVDYTGFEFRGTTYYAR